MRCFRHGTKEALNPFPAGLQSSGRRSEPPQRPAPEAVSSHCAGSHLRPLPPPEPIGRPQFLVSPVSRHLVPQKWAESKQAPWGPSLASARARRARGAPRLSPQAPVLLRQRLPQRRQVLVQHRAEGREGQGLHEKRRLCRCFAGGFTEKKTEKSRSLGGPYVMLTHLSRNPSNSWGGASKTGLNPH